MIRLIALGVLVVGACGNVSRGQHDAEAPRDAAGDVTVPIDALSDASPDAPPLRQAREFVSGGTRMMGRTYTFDVQIGHAPQQSKIAGPTYKLEGNAAVKP